MKLWLSVVVALAVVAAFSLQIAAEEAQEPAPQKKCGKYFQKMDTDGDGTITKEEWKQNCNEKFKKMDADGDGSVSQEEMKACRKEKWGGLKEKGAAGVKKEKSAACVKKEKTSPCTKSAPKAETTE